MSQLSLPGERKHIFFTQDQLDRAIRRHGLPVRVHAAGCNQSVMIERMDQVTGLARKILQTAYAMGNGMFVE